ncbi:hypothetical protein VPH35_058941 [Triticum aestivum]
MEPVVHGRPASLDAHYPMEADQNSLVCLVNIAPPKAGFLPWLKRVFRQRLGITVVHQIRCQIAAMQASPVDVGNRTIWILPRNVGDNAFSFSYRHVVNLLLEKLSLELWNRTGMAASVASFPSLFRVEHACLHGSEFSSIFVLVKVEALQHIPHHLTFHHVKGASIYADVIINKIWDVARSLGAPTAPPHASDRHDGASPRQGHAHPRASSGVLMKPKFIKGATFSLPTAVQIDHEDEVRPYLHASLLVSDVRKPRATVTFDPEDLCFSFKLELGHCRSTSGVIQPTFVGGGLYPRTMPLLPAVESKYPPKPNMPIILLPTVGPLLSLPQGDLFPIKAHFPAIGICERTKFSPDGPSSCGLSIACQHQSRGFFLVATSLQFSSPPPVVDGLLLQLATAANGLALDLILASANQPPTGSVPADSVVLGSPEPAKHQAGDVIPVEAVVASQSPCRSPRIRSAYDGVHIGSCKKAKAATVAGLLELPLLETPTLMTRGKLKQIA